MYLVALIDVYSRYIVAGHCQTHWKLDFVLMH